MGRIELLHYPAQAHDHDQSDDIMHKKVARKSLQAPDCLHVLDVATAAID